MGVPCHLRGWELFSSSFLAIDVQHGRVLRSQCKMSSRYRFKQDMMMNLLHMFRDDE
jgi:hypothetical protein